MKCYRLKRINNIFNFAVYWVLVQAMFIASLWKELTMISVFLIDLFLKHVFWILIKKIKECRGKQPEEPADFL